MLIGECDYLVELTPKRKDPGIDRNSTEPRSFNVIVSRGKALPLGKLFEQFIFNLETINGVPVNNYFHSPSGIELDVNYESGELTAAPADLKEFEFPGSIKEESPDGGLIRWEILLRGDSIEDDHVELMDKREEKIAPPTPSTLNMFG